MVLLSGDDSFAQSRAETRRRSQDAAREGVVSGEVLFDASELYSLKHKTSSGHVYNKFPSFTHLLDHLINQSIN